MSATELLEARYRRGHTVWLRFRDGTAGEIDLGPELHSEVFEPLRDVEVLAIRPIPNYTSIIANRPQERSVPGVLLLGRPAARIASAKGMG